MIARSSQASSAVSTAFRSRSNSATARVRALGLTALENRLNHRFELLSGGDRAAPSRQQTMHALIAWSYDLLKPSEQQLLQRVSVFAGGWSLEAAESVCDEALAVLPSLVSLVEKSLIVRDLLSGGVRYRLLESTRDFAREATDAGEAAALGLRHARWIVELLRKTEERIDIEGANTRLAPLFADMENIRAALHWCEAAGEFALGAQIACRIPESSTGTGWPKRAVLGSSGRWRACVKMRNLEVAARLLAGIARLSSDANTRLNASERAVGLAQLVGDARLGATAYTRYAVALYTIGRLDEALAANDRACELLRLAPTESICRSPGLCSIVRGCWRSYTASTKHARASSRRFEYSRCARPRERPGDSPETLADRVCCWPCGACAGDRQRSDSNRGRERGSRA